MSQDIPSDDLIRLKQRVESNPVSVTDILALADAYADLEHWREAIEAYETAISLDPSQSEVFNTLGTVYEEVERFDEAEKAYQQAIALDPKISAAYYNLGCLYEDQQRLPEAIEVYKKYLQYVENVEELTIIKDKFTEVSRLKIRKIGSLSLAKMLGVMYTVIGLIVGIISIIFSLFFAYQYSFSSSLSLINFMELILFPVGYGIIGLISGLIIAAIYNFVAGRLGGIELETE
jgi:tetratricopeptide (TPR) repeat protein